MRDAAAKIVDDMNWQTVGHLDYLLAIVDQAGPGADLAAQTAARAESLALHGRLALRTKTLMEQVRQLPAQFPPF